MPKKSKRNMHLWNARIAKLSKRPKHNDVIVDMYDSRLTQNIDDNDNGSKSNDEALSTEESEVNECESNDEALSTEENEENFEAVDDYPKITNEEYKALVDAYMNQLINEDKIETDETGWDYETGWDAPDDYNDYPSPKKTSQSRKTSPDISDFSEEFIEYYSL